MFLLLLAVVVRGLAPDPACVVARSEARALSTQVRRGLLVAIAANPTTNKFSSRDFEFEYTSDFEIKPKPVKTHLDEVLVKNGKRQIGVVVDPVKLASLADFGSPGDVGARVVAAERARDGVTAADLLDARALPDGSYRLEYTNASSRGDTHFLARVTVANGRLYILTAQARLDDFPDAAPALNLAADSFRLYSSRKNKN
ncbi:hypothetical protein CTAYLR_006516 [Chrysophaeum taylorii]|uniref:PsbP C-terminal domain-containing protein n=1 Tax=Chrysophaeum taylorii TaxID=2483200 RepID=A0AAD7XQ48_9STRA|nr:hypothetical protein CTAYLR_006516 [Chrysophaeum taylorii]